MAWVNVRIYTTDAVVIIALCHAFIVAILPQVSSKSARIALIHFVFINIIKPINPSLSQGVIGTIAQCSWAWHRSQSLLVSHTLCLDRPFCHRKAALTGRVLASHETPDGLYFDRRRPYGRRGLRSIRHAVAACAENHGRRRRRRFAPAGRRRSHCFLE